MRYTDATGTHRRESTGTRLKTEAQALLEQRRVEGRKGPLLPIRLHNQTTFADLCDKYEKTVVNLKSYQTERRYRIARVKKALGAWPLQRFTADIVEEFRAKRRVTVKPATANRELALIKRMIRKARSWKMIHADQADDIRSIELEKENNGGLRWLKPHEVTLLLEHCKDPLKSIVVVAVNTGMRYSELLGMTWPQVDFDSGFINLPDTKNGEERNVPMNSVVQETIKRLPKLGPYVFSRYGGKPIRDIRKALKRAVESAGLAPLTFHAFRHTFCSAIVKTGTPLPVIQKITGHKTLKMLLRYTHIADEERRQAVEGLYGAFSTNLAQRP